MILRPMPHGWRAQREAVNRRERNLDLIVAATGVSRPDGQPARVVVEQYLPLDANRDTIERNLARLRALAWLDLEEQRTATGDHDPEHLAEITARARQQHRKASNR